MVQRLPFLLRFRERSGFESWLKKLVTAPKDILRCSSIPHVRDGIGLHNAVDED